VTVPSVTVGQPGCRSRAYSDGMARYEVALTGDVDLFVAHLDGTIQTGSVSAKFENGSDCRLGEARMVVRVYERYSATGRNRVSLSISILSVGDDMTVSAITSGGSTAAFWKVNTMGEESFLDKAVDAIGIWVRATNR
jgi:hypothetical protein